MILLDGLDFQFAPFLGPDGVQGGPGRGHGGGVGDVVLQGHQADGAGIAGGLAPFRGIDQQGDFLALDAVDDVGPALPHLKHLRDVKALLPKHRRGAAVRGV